MNTDLNMLLREVKKATTLEELKAIREKSNLKVEDYNFLQRKMGERYEKIQYVSLLNKLEVTNVL